ncbi:MAG: cation:proton antiporter [Candidatus Verstraetearchaeota archaeon]|nr:cation:proton antiporter [Candidatus Verstraetearchaeota archaeon]
MSQLLAFTVTVLLAAIMAVAMKKAGVSVIAGYLLSGVLVGPALGIYGEEIAIVDFFSEIAIALVCFQIGLMVKAGFLKKHGPAAFAAVMAEVIIIAFLTFLIGIPFGIGIPMLIVIVIIASNSSSLVAFSLMEEKKKFFEGSLFKRVFGITVLEDIIQMTGLALLPSLSVFGALMVEEGFYRVSSVVFVVLIMFAIGVQIVPKVLSLISKVGDNDLAVLALVGLAIGFGWMSSYVGASFALGAFIAGLICSTLNLPKAVLDRFDSLRGFFTIIFFVSIGTLVPPFSSIHGILLSSLFAILLVSTKYLAFVTANFLSGIGLKDALRSGLFLLAISEFSLVISREAYRIALVGDTVFTGTVLAVILSTLLASKLTDSDERVADAIYRLVPYRIEVALEELSGAMKERLLSVFGPSKFKELVVMILKKIVSFLAIFTVGSLLIQGSLFMPQTRLVIAGELFVLAAMSILSLAVLRSAFKDIEGLLKSMRWDPDRAKDLGWIIRGVFNSLLALSLLLFLVFNASRFIREAFATYLELVYANVITFAVIMSLTVLLAYPFFSKIRRFVKRLEEAVEEI